MRHAHVHHWGVSATLKEIKRKCFWPNCALDVAQMIRSCSICLEKHRVDLHDGEAFNRGLVHVWERVHVDLIGPFSPLSEDRNGYVLTVLDSYSRHVQVVPLEKKRADTVAEAWVFKVLLEHGVPKVLYSDQGTEFKNQLMRRIAKYFGTTQKFTLMNSPHSNNVERLHQTLGNLIRMLKSRRMKSLEEWDKLVIMAAHAVNNSFCTSTGVTPNFLFLGRDVRAPLDNWT